MRVNKKQLLGFGGLAFVVGLTTIAYNLPTSATSVGGAVEVRVEVYNISLETVIQSPEDGDIVSDKDVTFSEMHSHASNVKYYLTYVAEDGTETVHELTDQEISGTDLTGRTEFTLDLDNYGGAGTYIFRSVATNDDGVVREDAVQFTYAGSSADQDDVVVDGDNKKIAFRVCYTAGVDKLVYQIFDKNGNPVSNEYEYEIQDTDCGDCVEIEIPLEGDDAPDLKEDGQYTVVIKSYDENGNPISTSSVYFDYEAKPDDIDVPDTGSILKALNISKADFMITGLVGFTIISLISLFVIRRSHKK